MHAAAITTISPCRHGHFDVLSDANVDTEIIDEEVRPDDDPA
jgi:hypothetical protein